MPAPRETQRSTNTLVCLLQGLVGHVVKIELRNEASILGRIVHVDGYMDVDMVNVSYTDVENKTTHFEDFHIQGRNIRFVQVPDELNMLNVISQQLQITCRSTKLARVEPRIPHQKGKKGALARAKDTETIRKERAIRKSLREARLRQKVAETRTAITYQENPESNTKAVNTFQKNPDSNIDGGSETEPVKTKTDA